jgi:hypothetical protein
LLRAVVQVALEPPALGITGFNASRTRSAKLFELPACLGLQPLVIER